ncbi:MAG TPA: hypothetical protein VK002_00930 [Rubricoccaceae bacterium]|nr:hypothetical protein [Rubricoccaceae bacterium]
MPLRPLLLALLLPLTGCGLFRPAAAPPPDAAVLVLINRAEIPVRYVYLSPCDAGEWGPDRMAPDEVVMPGQSRTFALEPGCWDARAVFRDGREAEERGVAMTRGSHRTWTVMEPEG